MSYTKKNPSISNQYTDTELFQAFDGGIADGTPVDTIADLKSISVSTLVSGEARQVLGYYAAGDGGGGIFRYSSSSTATDDGGTVIAPTSGGGRWLRVLDKGYLSVLWFGAKGDGVQDDAPFIRNAIAAVGWDSSTRIGKLIFPSGADNVYLCNSSLVAGTMMHDGITFEATGVRGGADAVYGTVIKYTGSGICWNVLQSAWAGTRGNWQWKNFTFQCTNLAGTMFGFQDMSLLATDPGLGGLEWGLVEACSFWGAAGMTAGTGVTGNAIQANNFFELVIDGSCAFFGWKRGVWLKACDNSTVGGRYINNARHIMLESNETGGNDLDVRARYLGPNDNSGVESSCKLWIESTGTTVYHVGLEVGSQADFYLNAEGIVIIAPTIGHVSPTTAPNNVLFHLGPNGRDVKVYAPRGGGPAGATVNVFDEPTTWNWSYNGSTSYQMLVFEPDRGIEEMLSPHPRMKVFSQYSFLDKITADALITSTGEAPSRTLSTAFRPEKTTQIGGSNYISGVVADATAFGGYAVKLNSYSGSGPSNTWMAALYVGKDVRNGQTVRVTMRYRVPTTPTVNNTLYFAQKNGVPQTSDSVSNSTTYVNAVRYFTVSGASAGDQMSFGLNNGGNTDLYISSILLEVLPDIASGVQTIANNGTIDISSTLQSFPVTASAPVTGAIMGAGLYDGQVARVSNRSANSITFAVVGTSLVADGASSSIPANRGQAFTWDANYGGTGVGRWVRLN